MTRLYLIRHGRPTSNWGRGDADAGLEPAGAAQARAARDWLLSLPQEERPTGVVSSPLRRCRETAQPTADALGVEVQIEAAVGEIPTPAALAEAERPVWLQAVLGGRWRDIGGDLDYEAWRRDVTKSLAGRGGAAVFSHFVAINAVVSLLSGDDRVVAFRPDHASITILETDGRDLRLVASGAEAMTGVL